MKFKIVLVLFLLVSIMLASMRYAFSSERFQPLRPNSASNSASTVLPDLDIKGNSTYLIENGYFVVNGSITVEQNGTLIIKNATLNLNVTSPFLYTYEDATVQMSNVTVYNAGSYFYSYIEGKSSLTVNACAFIGSSYFYSYDMSKASFTGSTVYSLTAYDNATVSLSNTRMQYFYCYGASKTTISQSTMRYLYVEYYSSAFVSHSTVSDMVTLEFLKGSAVSLSLPHGMVNLWSLYGNSTVTKAYVNLTLLATRVTLWTLYVYDTAAVNVSRSDLDEIYAYDNSRVRFVQDRLNYLFMYDHSNATLVDSTVTDSLSITLVAGSRAALSLHGGQFSHWNLFSDNVVSSSWLDVTLQNVSVANWEISAYSSVISLTNSNVEYLSTDGNSTITINASSINGIYSYDKSQIKFTSGNVGWADTYGKSKMSIENSTVSNAYAYDNSTVSMKLVSASLVGVYDYASMLLVDSFATDGIAMSFVRDTKLVLPALPSGNIEHWNLYKNASVTMAYVNLTLVNTKVRGWDSFNTQDEAAVSFKGCSFSYVDCDGLSMVTLTDSMADSIYLYENSSASITNSSVGTIEFVIYDNANISFNSLPTGWVDHWSLYANAVVTKAYSNCTITTSWINQWEFVAYNYVSLSFKQCVINDVYVSDSCKLQMNNCTVNYVEGYSRSQVTLINTIVLDSAYAYDASVWTIINSNIQDALYLRFMADSEVYGLSLPTGLISHWNISSTSKAKRVFLNLTVTNSKVKTWGIYTNGFSIVSVNNSNIQDIGANDFSEITMKNCTIDTAYLNSLSQLHLSSVLGSESTVVTMYTYDMSVATLTQSRVATIYAYYYSTVDLLASEFGAANVYDNAEVLVARSLDVHVIDAAGKNIGSANVTVRSLSGIFAQSELTNSEGLATFEVPETTIDVLGSHPTGNYTVTAKSEEYNSSKVIDVTENQEVVIVLSYIVNEFSPSLLTLIMASITVIAILARKRPHGTKNPNKLGIKS